MQEDHFSAAERILLDIQMVFKKDPKLKEFDIIPVKINQNKSPVIHVDHCMGLESWCVRHIYSYVYRHIMDCRQLNHRREDPSIVGRWLLGALLINPDVSTFWNMRKEMINKEHLDIHTELHLTSVVLSRKPKSAEAFAYRKWLSDKLLSQPDGVNIEMIMEREFGVSEAASNRCPNNYHSWTHRIWCLSKLAPLTSNLLKVLLEEWVWSEEWIKLHVSDHSGFHYHQCVHKQLSQVILVDPVCNPLLASLHGRDLLEKSINSINQYISFHTSAPEVQKCKIANKSNVSSLVSSVGLCISELLLNADLILIFSSHEALWCHRRFLLTNLKAVLDSRERYFSDGNQKLRHRTTHKNKEGIPLEKDQKLCDLSESEEDGMCHLIRQVLLRRECLLISQSTVREDYQARLAEQHKNWLTHVLGIDLLQCNN